MELFKKWWFWVIVFLIILLIIFFYVPAVICGIENISADGIPTGEFTKTYLTLYEYLTQGCPA